MCRFVFYLGPEITLGSLTTDPVHSLIKQSYHAREREEPLNGDGFGVAWYQHDIHDRPVIFKEISPAWSSINLASIGPVTRSRCLLAHVRAATPGLPVTQLDCHPFGRGRFAFMHNGHLGDFPRVRRPLLESLSDAQFAAMRSSGDSELLFAAAMGHLEGIEGEPGLGDLADALEVAITRSESLLAAAGSGAPSFLNLVLTDGRQAVVSRYVTPGGPAAQSLYLREGGRYHCADGACAMSEAEGDERTVIVSSEPISDDLGWRPAPVNHLMLVGPDHRVSYRELAPVRALGSA